MSIEDEKEKDGENRGAQRREDGIYHGGREEDLKPET